MAQWLRTGVATEDVRKTLARMGGLRPGVRYLLMQVRTYPSAMRTPQSKYVLRFLASFHLDSTQVTKPVALIEERREQVVAMLHIRPRWAASQ